MEYKLAQELKDAGFEYSWCGDTLKYCDEDCLPKLSELIEACGDKFGELVRLYNGEWEAHTAPQPHFIYKGKTPEEAVARLWLELNK